MGKPRQRPEGVVELGDLPAGSEAIIAVDASWSRFDAFDASKKPLRMPVPAGSRMRVSWQSTVARATFVVLWDEWDERYAGDPHPLDRTTRVATVLVRTAETKSDATRGAPMADAMDPLLRGD